MLMPPAKRKSQGTAKNSKRRRTQTAALTGVALTATVLTAAIARPDAPAAPALRSFDIALAADPIAWPMFGIGPLGDLVTNLLTLTGNNPLNVDPVGITYSFPGGAPTTQSIYQRLINDLPYTPVADLPYGAPCSQVSQTSCRTAYLLSTGIGALGTMDAVRALIDSAQGNTPTGFDPIKPAAGGTGMTSTVAFYLNNMLRADGGLAARFPDLLTAFGINPAAVDTGEFGPDKDGSSVYNLTTNISWPYNTLADFPITANPISLANSLLAVIPPVAFLDEVLKLASQSALDAFNFVLSGSAGTLATENFDDVFPVPPQSQCTRPDAPPRCEGWSSFGGNLYLLSVLQGQIPLLPPFTFDDFMIGANYRSEIPLTYPTRVASWLVNPLLKAVNSPYLLGTPTSDILTPALKILVNIGYDDVLTPDKLNDVDPTQQKTYADIGYQAYDRTYYQVNPDKPTPFSWFNNPAMTTEQTTAAVGDAWDAFTAALKAQTDKPLWGILVPNPDVPPTPTTMTSAAEQAVPAAAAVTAEESAPEAPAHDPTPAEAEALDAAIALAPEEPVAPAADRGNAAAASKESGQGAENNASARRARSGRG